MDADFLVIARLAASLARNLAKHLLLIVLWEIPVFLLLVLGDRFRLGGFCGRLTNLVLLGCSCILAFCLGYLLNYRWATLIPRQNRGRWEEIFVFVRSEERF